MEIEYKDNEKPNKFVEALNITNPSSLNKTSTVSLTEEVEIEKKKGCKFQTAYSFLLLIELIIFILTYIIPKGQFDKIQYSSDKKIFIIKYQNDTIKEINATKYVLDELKIRIPIDSFTNGYIKNEISIPNSYKRIQGKKTNFFNIFLYPVLGLIDSANISFFLFILGGSLNILIEMNALSSAMKALGRVTKGKEFLLLILVYIIISACGFLLGLMEEFLPFYPILVPIFLKSGFDAMISFGVLYLPMIMGNMFSILSPFATVIASYSAGINFIDGILFRTIYYFLGNIITIMYIYFYYRRIRLDKTKSVVYDIKKIIEKKFLINEKELKKKDTLIEERDSEVKEDNNLSNEQKEKEKENEKEKDEFTIKQKISLIIFLIGFSVMIFGVVYYKWWFEQMTTIFIVFSIILMILLQKGEEKGIEIFLKGAGEFIGVSIIMGMARAINITLEEGKIADTILNALTNSLNEIPKIFLAIIMLLIFIFLGIFISSTTGLAILTMPVFAPLGDQVNLSKVVIINTYLCGQLFSSIITPTGLILIALQLVGIPYNYWIKFIWPFMVILFIFLVVIIIVNALFQK